MVQIFGFLYLVLRAIPDLFGILKAFMKMAQDYKTAEEKRLFIKEVKEAVRESQTTFDNTRLVNILNPISEPLPRGMPNEADPKV